MASRGAWPFAYRLGLDFRNDPQGRGAHGMAAFKRELHYVGLGEGLDLASPLWDDKTDSALREFQREHGLTEDGQLGPETAALLFKQRTIYIERVRALPPGLLTRVSTYLSKGDPVAEAVHDLDCEGLAQINMRYNPQVTLSDAWDPAFALERVGTFIAFAWQYVGGDWDAAIAAYLIGRGPAADWVTCGKPGEGGVSLGGRDAFTRATEIVAAVEEAPC